MSVHYKFKSALEYDTVTFDGLHITVKDLKNAIIQQKRIGKNTDFDLQVTNAQTKEVYEDEEALIPKNTSLLIARIPVLSTNKSKTWEGYGGDNAPITRADEGGPIAKAVDLSSLDASEDDKIRAMMSQSTQDYDPSNYQKIRGANQVGVVPPNYRCYKCHQTGHWIKDCPLSQGTEPMEIKKSTGIPRSFMVPVEGPQVQGAMMTPNGSYAVPVLDHQTYTQKQQPAPQPVQEEQPEIPEDLICSICSGLLTDAVMIPCCGNSFCDECIRSCLLESEEHECPDCHERDISPGTLIPNRYLRNSVANFKNTTGYVKKPTYKPPQPTQQTKQETSLQTEIENKNEITEKTTPLSTETQESTKSLESTEKTIISEADSTEHPKANATIEFIKDLQINDANKESPSKSSISEGPPGVSPRREKSPKPQSVRRGSHSSSVQNNGRSRRNSKDISPRQHTIRRSPNYDALPRIEERPGTPTVDEPGGSTINSNIYPPTSAPYPSAPPPGVLPPMMGMPPPHMQGPPPNYPSGQPPPFSSQGPPPNFRLPPPGANTPAPFIPGPYNAPPRPIFDPSRPPVQGPPPNFSNYSSRSRNREFNSSRLRTRTPPGIIDDPLEAFNRMLREKDERNRRAKQKKGRSYSRSSSRSYSRSPKRPRSRSPRRRNSRSRSRSFSMSRSRTRSFTPSPRNSPYRDYSPRNSSPRRRPPSRFRSPARSPPPRYRYKDGPINDRNRDRDFDRPPQRDRDRGFSRDRDFNYYNEDRAPPQRWGGGPPSNRPMQDNYYPPPEHSLPPPPTNRYPPRDNYQSFNKNEPPPQHHMPPIAQPQQSTMHPPPRRFDDIAPPGTDQPPIPGEELPPHYEERYNYQQEPANKERFNDRDNRNKEEDRRNFDKGNRDNREEEKPRRFERFSKSPGRGGFKSPIKSKEHHESPDKHKRRKREHSEEKEKDKRDEKHDRKRDLRESDDEKKRSKDKKKKRDKKESEKRKRKEKKERKEQDKVKKEDKEKKKDKDEDVQKENQSKHVIAKAREEKKEVNITSKTPEKPPEVTQIENAAEAPDLYDDLLSDGVDKVIVKNYGKLEAIMEQDDGEKTPEIKKIEEEEPESKEENEYPPESETSKDEDVLDLHANEAELKAELEKAEVLAPLPEKSKWELDDDVTLVSVETKMEGKQERNGKVTTEVLKRAENAIFAKAINAIRPIEIKKISMDRAKLYTGERDKDRKIEEQDIRNIQVTISSAYDDEMEPPGVETVTIDSDIQKPPPRLSVKERLGVKVDDLERIVKVSFDRNRSRSLSPLSKRARDERIHLDRRIEVDDRRRDDRMRHDRDRYHRNNYRNLDRNEFRRREEFLKRERERQELRREKSRTHKDETKRKRSRSRSGSKEHKHRKKDKKQKKEKSKKHKRDEKDESKFKDEGKSEKREGSVKPKSATDKRKATLDEANFEPDYDLESDSDKDDTKKSPPVQQMAEEEKKRFKIVVEEKEQKDSSSTDSSDSSSEEERKKKKHRKHKKKKSRRETSSSSSSSDTDSSEEEKERKRKKHKKKQKKRKKSKHK